MQDQQLTIGLDLGDRSSFYCVLNGAGEVILEERVATNPEAMKKTFGKMPRSRIALETGTHSPWVSRLLAELGHEVIELYLSITEDIATMHPERGSLRGAFMILYRYR